MRAYMINFSLTTRHCHRPTVLLTSSSLKVNEKAPFTAVIQFAAEEFKMPAMQSAMLTEGMCLK